MVDNVFFAVSEEKVITPLIEYLKEKRESRIAARQAVIAQVGRNV